MKRGKTDRETVELNGWKVGDVLEGDDGYGLQRIKITAIGHDAILCRWDYDCDGDWSGDKLTTLNLREWRKI